VELVLLSDSGLGFTIYHSVCMVLLSVAIIRRDYSISFVAGAMAGSPSSGSFDYRALYRLALPSIGLARHRPR
jgi:hypothetical protein